VPQVFECVSNVNLCARGLLVVRIRLEEVLEPGLRRSITALFELVDGRTVDRRRTGGSRAAPRGRVGCPAWRGSRRRRTRNALLAQRRELRALFLQVARILA